MLASRFVDRCSCMNYLTVLADVLYRFLWGMCHITTGHDITHRTIGSTLGID